MKKNWDRAAMRFASARFVRRQGMLDVAFENGDRFLVAAESLVPAGGVAPARAGARLASRTATLAPPDWAKMRIGATGDVLEVPLLGSTLEIPWDRVRSVADGAFREHLAQAAAERVRRLGNRIRALRLEAGLTRAALADKVGLSREALAELEAGASNPTADLLEEIALALGRRLKDFAEA